MMYGQKLTLKTVQQLVMSQQMQQAIKLLQMSRQELIQRVQQELKENPLLEEATDADPAEDVSGEIPVAADAASRPEEHAAESQSDQVYDREIARNEDWEFYLGELPESPFPVHAREHDIPEEMTALEARHAAPTTLASHLMWQLRLSSMTEKQKGIGELVIGNLSSTGYLQATLEEIADMAGCRVVEVEPVLAEIQNFDPVGVAARTPEECLLVQIRMLHYDQDPVLVSLVKDHLHDLEDHQYRHILHKLHLEMADLVEYIRIIQSLDPMPGASYGQESTAYITPDAYVFEHDGEFVVLLNDDDIPALRLSGLYSKSSGTTRQDRKYIAEKKNAAVWFIKSLWLRQRTLRDVVSSIVKHQKEFFREGVSKLRPLILKDIADDIGVHESTVSRLTSNKYVATPHGMFELKFFFNSGLKSDDGDQVGSESVKALIRKWIGEEDRTAPLTDECIVKKLEEKLGIKIARRTVAKYRTAMNIASSSRRRTCF